MENKDCVEESIPEQIIINLRTGDYATALSKLNRFLLCLQGELFKTKIRPDLLNKISYSLETLMEMQKQEDWVAVADILEYEFLKLWENLRSTG